MEFDNKHRDFNLNQRIVYLLLFIVICLGFRFFYLINEEDTVIDIKILQIYLVSIVKYIIGILDFILWMIIIVLIFVLFLELAFSWVHRINSSNDP